MLQTPKPRKEGVQQKVMVSLDEHFRQNSPLSPGETGEESLNDEVPKKKKSKKKYSSSSGSVASTDTKDAKKKKKKKSKDSSEGEQDDGVSVRSSRSIKSSRSTRTTGTVKKKKKKPKESEDDVSVTSKSSRRSRRTTDGDDDTSVSSKKSKRSSKKNASLADELPPDPKDQFSPRHATSRYHTNDGGGEITDLKAENEALLAETAALRQQLNEALSSAPTYVEEMHSDLKKYESNVAELRAEIEEYEQAVMEKDGLIKKLTEAVDAQLDKVEFLELKLQRAEEEFVKMEDELKDYEDEIEALRAQSIHTSSHISDSWGGDRGTGSVHSTESLRIVADDMDRRLIDEKQKRLELLEQELIERETILQDREQYLLDREEATSVREQELLVQGQRDVGTELDDIRIRELSLDERERELKELEKRLQATAAAAQDERYKELKGESFSRGVEASHDNDLQESLGAIEVSPRSANDTANDQSDEIAALRARIIEVEKERDVILAATAEMSAKEADTTDRISELEDFVEEYKQEITRLEEANAYLVNASRDKDEEHEQQIQSIQEGNNLQIQELYEENRNLQTECTVLREQHDRILKSIPEEEVDPMDHAMAGLQDEIAGLREKIVGMERESKSRYAEINQYQSDIEEKVNEIKELESQISDFETQMKENKVSAERKMSQKDETISFMQNEIVRIMREKAEVEKNLREREKLLKQKQPLEQKTKNIPQPVEQKQNNKKDEEVAAAKIRALEEQISDLEEANKKLQQELDHTGYQHGLQLKEKDAQILGIEAELADLNWELKARKEADYVALLKDRKERKQELDRTKKELKSSEERVADLQGELEALRQNQNDLEKDVSELNKSLVSRDSGDYVSGLKRQIRSLKEHNMTLERRVEIEAGNTKDIIKKKDAKILALSHKIREIERNPAQAVVRGMLNFGKRSEDELKFGSTHSLRSSSHHSMSPRSPSREQRVSKRIEKQATASPQVNSIWAALRSPFQSQKRISQNPAPTNSGGEESTPRTSGLEEPETLEENLLEKKQVSTGSPLEVDRDSTEPQQPPEDDSGSTVATNSEEEKSSSEEAEDLVDTDDDGHELFDAKDGDADIISEHKTGSATIPEA